MTIRHQTVTYGNKLCAFLPLHTEIFRLRISVTHLIPSKIPLVLGGAHYLRTLLCISEPHSYAGLNSQCYLHRPIFLTMIRIYLYNTLSSKSQMLLCCFPIRIAIIISLFVNKNYITHKRTCCISHDTAQSALTFKLSALMFELSALNSSCPR